MINYKNVINRYRSKYFRHVIVRICIKLVNCIIGIYWRYALLIMFVSMSMTIAAELFIRIGNGSFSFSTNLSIDLGQALLLLISKFTTIISYEVLLVRSLTVTVHRKITCTLVFLVLFLFGKIYFVLLIE